METIAEWQPAGAQISAISSLAVLERPSETFVRAVADLLETDADDILAELGYEYREAVVRKAKLRRA